MAAGSTSRCRSSARWRKRGAELLHGSESSGRGLGECPADGFIDRRRHAGLQPPYRGNRRTEYPGDHVLERQSGIRRSARQHLIQDASQAVDIGALVQITVFPELLLAIAAIVLLLLGVTFKKREQSVAYTAGAIVILIGVALWVMWRPAEGVVFNGGFIADDFSRCMKVLVLFGSAFALLISISTASRNGLDKFEYSVLVMLATIDRVLTGLTIHAPAGAYRNHDNCHHPLTKRASCVHPRSGRAHVHGARPAAIAIQTHWGGIRVALMHGIP